MLYRHTVFQILGATRHVGVPASSQRIWRGYSSAAVQRNGAESAIRVSLHSLFLLFCPIIPPFLSQYLHYIYDYPSYMAIVRRSQLPVAILYDVKPVIHVQKTH